MNYALILGEHNFKNNDSILILFGKNYSNIVSFNYQKQN